MFLIAPINNSKFALQIPKTEAQMKSGYDYVLFLLLFISFIVNLLAQHSTSQSINDRKPLKCTSDVEILPYFEFRSF